MISMKMDVLMTSGDKVPVIVTPKAQVEFERHYKLGIANAFGDDMRMEYIYFLAWKAMVHIGRTTKSFDDWLDDVEDIEMAEDDAVPLAPDQSPT